MTSYERTILNIIAQEGGYTSASKIARKMKTEVHKLKSVLGLLGKNGLIDVFSGKYVFKIGGVELTSKGWRAVGRTEEKEKELEEDLKAREEFLAPWELQGG